jgi:methylated-DNA-[protein]-cysteine S-methyltransferase
MLQWTEVTLVDDLKLRLVASNCGLCGLQFEPFVTVEGERDDDSALLHETADQLRAYFDRKLREFSIPLDLEGTEFQKDVWQQLREIPYGETRSYVQIAEAIGRPKAVRAVGAANGSNPVAIVVPCHRVIGSSGRLTGYGGGLPLKKRLLELEGAWTMALSL